jgi:histidinol-phosphate/aromatic aminotransferase/cobyric acid decarboxylase-like protein
MAMTSAPPPGPHGGEGPRLAAHLGVEVATVLDLSQSLNPVAPDVPAIVARHLDVLARYPDPTAATDALATAIGVDAGRVLLTNGGSEAIALVAGHLGRGWVDEPDFSLYRRYLGDLDRDGARFRSNPHSPSGRLAAPDERADVWDEAFYPLATGDWTRGDANRGSWVVGSLTKLFACPGLRIGYVLAPDAATLEPLRTRQPEWSVGTLACAALPELLAAVDLRAWSKRTTELRDHLVTLLRAHGHEPWPSDANWVLVDAPDLREALAPHAIAVRDCTSFGLRGVVRIAVPDATGLDRLEGALDNVERGGAP